MIALGQRGPRNTLFVRLCGQQPSLDNPMKRLIVIAAGTVALMSGAAYAGGDGGCAYSKHLAATEATQSPVMSAVEESEAERLKKLAALEAQASLDALIETPVIHN